MRTIIITLVGLVLFVACQKEEENPFAQDVVAPANPTVASIPQGNFAWLHQRIFRPSCALSGCHDGSFEPEFRTISGAYNSLVMHPVIANDPQNSFTHRVVPGDVSASFLHERLTAFVPNTSGMMPLGLPEDSDWPANEQAYINAIDQWIQGGARNMFGELPTSGDLQPQAIGLLAFPGGAISTAYPRGTDAGVQPIEVPAATVDLWFAFADDATAATDLSVNTYKLSTSIGLFPAIPFAPLQTGASINGPDFGNSTTSFTHKAALDLSGYAPGTVLFVRAYVSDGSSDTPTEIPNDGTQQPMLNYFTLRITP
jgi:hypothetical protein